jgi:phosphoglycolate phosphatase-like HAD superfamily hydrolase
MDEVRGYVFDLDGTLANTACLTSGRRTPALVLELSDAWSSMRELNFSHDVRRLPSRLIRHGYRVGIVTRSPLAYASTLLGILRIDYEFLLAANSYKSPAERLRAMARAFSLDPHNLCYVADREDEDAQAALDAGTKFRLAPWTCDPTWSYDKNHNQHRIQVLRGVPHDDATNDIATRPSGIRCLVARLRNGESLRRQDLDAVLAYFERSGVPGAKVAAAVLLGAGPQRECRWLQKHFFERLEPAARVCVIDRAPEIGRCDFPTPIMTQAESFDAQSLKQPRNSALRRMFPLVNVEVPGVKVPIHACVRYRGSAWGHRLWEPAKDWHGRYASGPEPRVSLIELPATVLGAHISERYPDAGVAAVPASPFSPDKPAQVSERLARRAAVAAGTTCLPYLSKRDGQINCEFLPDRPVVLIDDQTTTGQTLTAAIRALTEKGATIVGALTWSASNQMLSAGAEPYQDDIKSCWLADGFDALGLFSECWQHGERFPARG